MSASRTDPASDGDPYGWWRNIKISGTKMKDFSWEELDRLNQQWVPTIKDNPSMRRSAAALLEAKMEYEYKAIYNKANPAILRALSALRARGLIYGNNNEVWLTLKGRRAARKLEKT
jgi:hypothetical protein